ncbi:AAA-like domain-containing protein [Pseudomonas alabamensis]|uniref:AAA-like domain-containing protein n=1 Tax=Pseudomonas alabamensis TaxID=3064349 RepID=UPI000A2F6609
MVTKKIKPYAIVPPDMYVERQADIQLRQIIEDMGRPSYVLVSRQMGKTNLLLNAKREIDSQDDLFSYLDVSNCFSDLRSFFRNIIDTTILARDQLSEVLFDDLTRMRSSTVNLQAHKEHELELKKILDILPGKLVICLDEIDALTNVDYSDNVFSLIRSIYFFGRTQFAQFKRLTYVLSGVADPAELIKNKAISPFNIGEKIYLEDFTFSETKRFLEQCSLVLPDEAVERIYHWTSGNPRVTWDVCSAAETELSQTSMLNESSIDKIVNSLYLTSFDLPPFDHIRTRVQSDKELRNSVMVIHYGKTKSLSDKVKDKLYLAGISTPKTETGEISFKNRIMSESLSEKWVSDIEGELLTIDERANEKIKLKRYDEALALYRESLAQHIDPESCLASRLNIGFCLIQLGDIESAIVEYESCDTNNIDDRSLLNAKLHWSGVCYMFSHRWDDAAAQFRALINGAAGNKKGIFFPEACVNLASVLLAQADTGASNTALPEEIEHVLLSAIDYVRTVSSSGSATENHILYSAYYQLSRYYSMAKNADMGRDYLDEALEVSISEVRSTLLYQRASYESDPFEQAKYYERCARNIIDNKLSLTGKDISNQLRFGHAECSPLLMDLVRLDRQSAADELYRYICSIESKQNFSAWEVITNCVMSGASGSDISKLPDLTRLALRYKSAPVEELRQILTLSILVNSSTDIDQNKVLYDAYLSLFGKLENPSMLEGDFRIIHDIFSQYFIRDEYERCEEIIAAIEVLFEQTVEQGSLSDQVISSGALILLLLRLRLNTSRADSDSLPSQLMPYLDNIKSTDSFSLLYFPSDYSESLAQAFRKMVHPDFFDENAIDIGQNVIVTVQYNSGKVKQGKFKKFKLDIIKKLCRVV